MNKYKSDIIKPIFKMIRMNDQNKPYLAKVIAHKGASAYAPENTIEAVKLASEMGARCVELDVVLTKLNEFVIVHDNNLKKLTGVNKNVSDLSYQELLEIDFGVVFSEKYKGTKIANLDKMVECVLDCKINVNFEIKPFKKNDLLIGKLFANYLLKKWPKDKKMPLVSSFSKKVLQSIKDVSDSIPLGLLIHRWSFAYKKTFQKLNCQAIGINHSIINTKRMKELQELTKYIYAYTVNDAKTANKLFKLGVVGIFTDYPDLLNGHK